MAQFVQCLGEISNASYGGYLPRCSTEWVVVTSSDIIATGLNSSLPTPEGMLLALSAGLASMVPLYGTLWAVRAARQSLKNS